MGKIGELLSDEESVRQLSELAQMLMTNSAEAPEENGNSDEIPDNDSGDSSGDSPVSELFPKGFDLSSIMKLQGIMGAMTQKDKNAELLLALKPHLREEKREKVDKAIKLLKLMAVWNIIKDSGMLKDFL